MIGRSACRRAPQRPRPAVKSARAARNEGVPSGSADLRDFLLSRQPGIQEVHFLGEDGGQQAQNLPSQARRGARDRLLVWIEPAGDAAWLQALPRWDSCGADPVRLTGPRSGPQRRLRARAVAACAGICRRALGRVRGDAGVQQGRVAGHLGRPGPAEPFGSGGTRPCPAATVAPGQARPRTRVAWSGRSCASTSAGLAGERCKRFRDFWCVYTWLELSDYGPTCKQVLGAAGAA